MSVFTVFFCGTGSSSFDYSNPDYHMGELVSTLARNCGGIEFVDWIIVDGPGSGNFQEDEKFVAPGKYHDLLGKALGWGWDENVAHAMAVIHGKKKWSRDEISLRSQKVLEEAGLPIDGPRLIYGMNGPVLIGKTLKRMVTQQDLQMKKIEIFRKEAITHINVVGWSRGAVTTHMFANALANDPMHKDTPVNIVAIDPVPGPLNFQIDRTSIPKNVKNYVAFFARDERSVEFTPTLASTAEHVNTTFYPMPGRHATLVGNAGNYINGNGANIFYGPGKIVRMLTEGYLENWGTVLSNRLNYSEAEMLQSYDEMLAQAPSFRTLSRAVYVMFRQNGGRMVGVAQNYFSTKFANLPQFQHCPPFINWHHRKLFEKAGGILNPADHVKNINLLLLSQLALRSKL